MFDSPWNYFTDPVLRASTIGSMLMCLASSLIGVLVFVRKRLLIGEALSHACYPGAVLGIIIGAYFSFGEHVLSLFVLVCAFLSAMAGLVFLEFLESRLHVKSDSALCLVLSAFFGIGVLLASLVQKSHAMWFKQMQVLLYGQAATMVDLHMYLYGALAAVVILFIYLSYSWIQISSFDRDFAKTIGIRLPLFDTCTFFLLGLAIVIGMRSVGLVLMSGMLIAPAVAARQLGNKLSSILIFAAFFSVVSAFLGNFLSVEVSVLMRKLYPGTRLSLPTGPMILLAAAFFCALSLLFAPGRGIFNRFLRILSFQNKCLGENLLKLFWKRGECTFAELRQSVAIPSLVLWVSLFQLTTQGWLKRSGKRKYCLTNDGTTRAEKIVRLHRLWEVYLVDYLGQGVEKVHCNAEKMEHILTPELEKELTELLGDPQHDPHDQPIPPKVKQ